VKVNKGLCLACEHSPEKRCFTLVVPNPNQILPFTIFPYDALAHGNEPSWGCKVQRSVPSLIGWSQCTVIPRHFPPFMAQDCSDKNVNKLHFAIVHCHMQCSASAFVDSDFVVLTVVSICRKHVLPSSFQYAPSEQWDLIPVCNFFCSFNYCWWFLIN